MTQQPNARAPKTLLIACGALAREVLMLIEANNWQHLELVCLPASLHNRPERIPEAIREKINEERENFENIVALYGDCGTGGMLDAVLQEEGVERIHGAHCYEFYTGTVAFEEIVEQELGSFYLTDFLVRQFDTLIMKGMGIDKHPELLPMYFGNYKRLVYLAQIDDPALQEQAKVAAGKLGLDYEYVFTGLGEFNDFLKTHTPSPTLSHEKV
ncbi:MAG: DUF1638 domain-containing protein [Rhodospirillales bacterium]|jgi:hypothetical protein|nr:DUF1638 domain-containing protein [Rhodospirillales bacterium]